jgi:hypothetical protein
MNGIVSLGEPQRYMNPSPHTGPSMPVDHASVHHAGYVLAVLSDDPRCAVYATDGIQAHTHLVAIAVVLNLVLLERSLSSDLCARDRSQIYDSSNYYRNHPQRDFHLDHGSTLQAQHYGQSQWMATKRGERLDCAIACPRPVRCDNTIINDRSRLPAGTRLWFLFPTCSSQIQRRSWRCRNITAVRNRCTTKSRNHFAPVGALRPTR